MFSLGSDSDLVLRARFRRSHCCHRRRTRMQCLIVLLPWDSWFDPKRCIQDPNQVQWYEDDPDNPQNWPFRYKWFVIGLCSFLTVNVLVLPKSTPLLQYKPDYIPQQYLCFNRSFFRHCSYCRGLQHHD